MEHGCETFDSIINFVKQHKWKSILIGMSFGYVTKRIYDRIYGKRHYYPPGPFSYPIVGNLLQLLYYPQYIYHHCAMTYGPIMMLNFLGLNLVLLNDSTLIKQILTRKDYLSRLPASYNDKNHSIWSVSLEKGKGVMPFIGSNGKEWNQRRKHSQSAIFKLMTTKKVSNITQTAIDNTLKPHLSQIIDNNKLWYPRKLCAYIAMNTIFHCCFAKSIDFNDKLYLELVHLLDESFRNAFQSEIFVELPFLRALNLEIHKKYIYIRQRRNQIVLDLIKERAKIFEKNNKEPECFVDSSLKSKQNGSMSQVEIVADTYFLFAAGMDTTSSTLEFGVTLAAKYKNITDIIRNELLKYHNTVSDDGFLLFNLKQLNKYSLFRAFIYEILRISSVVPIGVNHSNNINDTWITVGDKKYIIPKNSMVNYNVPFVHKWSDNENWKQNGDKICLDNWLVYDKNGSNPQFVKNGSFVSFGVGRRDCVGRLLATKEISIMLGHLILNYNLSLKDESIEIKSNMNVTSMIDPPIGVQISRIKH